MSKDCSFRRVKRQFKRVIRTNIKKNPDFILVAVDSKERSRVEAGRRIRQEALSPIRRALYVVDTSIDAISSVAESFIIEACGQDSHMYGRNSQVFSDKIAN